MHSIPDCSSSVQFIEQRRRDQEELLEKDQCHEAHPCDAPSAKSDRTSLAAFPAEAAPRTRCFPETGFCVSGSILTYWERNGGLPVFGYPISEVSPWVG